MIGDLRGARALVTGGAGFIGSTLVDRLVDAGCDVVVLDDLSSGSRADVHESATLVVGDVADPAVAARAAAGCDVVFHQAAHRSVFRSVEHPLQSDRANTGGTLAMLVAARDAGVRRFVYASSSSVYGGAAREVPTDETTPLRPRSPYAVSKLAGEEYCRVFAELHGLESLSLRYFNVYGPRQRSTSSYATVVPLFIRALRRGEPPELHGDGTQSRDFTYVDDVVAANIAAAVAPATACDGSAYNVSSGHERSLLDVLELLDELLGTQSTPHHAPPRAGDVRRTWGDASRARDLLGFVAQVPLEEGLRRAVAWALEHETA